ncbi:MAG TPA: hypothetical protein ACFYEC_01550 [Candidatus Brocadiaceae bacterium]
MNEVPKDNKEGQVYLHLLRLQELIEVFMETAIEMNRVVKKLIKDKDHV